MNGEDYPEKPSGFLLGKEFIIVIVIVFSGLSFTLGYFVGRKNGSTHSMTGLQASEGPSQINREATPAPSPEARQDVVPTQQSFQPSKDLTPVAAEGPAQEPEKQEPKEPGLKQKEQPKALVQQKREDSGAAKTEKSAAKNAAQSPAEKKETLYSVQIGAFKNPEEANQLKTAFEKKGYKTSLSSSKDKKGRKIYKVRTGEFSEKKEADVLALKLKKTEGLHTYVTSGDQ